MIHVTVYSEEELQKLAGEMLKILVNLRYNQRRWFDHFGYQAKVGRITWEDIADKFIEDLKAKDAADFKTFTK